MKARIKVLNKIEAYQNYSINTSYLTPLFDNSITLITTASMKRYFIEISLVTGLI